MHVYDEKARLDGTLRRLIVLMAENDKIPTYKVYVDPRVSKLRATKKIECEICGKTKEPSQMDEDLCSECYIEDAAHDARHYYH